MILHRSRRAPSSGSSPQGCPGAIGLEDSAALEPIHVLQKPALPEHDPLVVLSAGVDQHGEPDSFLGAVLVQELRGEAGL